MKPKPTVCRLLAGLSAILLLFAACTKNPVDPPGEPETPTPVILSFAPASGPAGSTVTITGSQYGTDAAQVQVKFNGTGAAITSIAANTITVTVPVGATSGQLSVSRQGKEAISSHSFTVTAPDTDPLPPVPSWSIGPFAGSGATGSADGAADAASFRTPKGMAADAAGNLYVADAAAHKIRKITPQGVVSTYAGTGARGFTNGDARTAATFNNPLHVALDAAGNLYVADGSNHAVRKITPAGVVSTLAGTGVAGFIDGPVATAQFSTPYGLAVDDVGNVYVGDHANHRIRKITPGGRVATIAGNGSSNSSDGMGIAAGISWPGGVALDDEGNLYVGEKGGGRIRKIAPDMRVTTIGGYLSVNNGPCHLAVDKNKNVYVLYRGLNRLRKYTPTGVETDIAGTGDPGGEDGAQGRFRWPEGMVMREDAQGGISFFIADTENKKIRKVVFQ